MAQEHSASDAQREAQKRTRLRPPQSTPSVSQSGHLPSLFSGPTADASLQNQVARLADPNLQSAQRQAWAGQIHQAQGNRHLQQIVQSLHTTRGDLPVSQEARRIRSAPGLQRWTDDQLAGRAGQGEAPPQPQVVIPDEDPSFDPATLVPAGLALEDAAALREIYANGVKAIKAEADLMLARGVSPTEVANWAAESRNNLKAQIRNQGPGIIKVIAEARNMKKYGNPLGLTAEQLRAMGKTNEEIIASAGRGNTGITKWAGRMRIAGRIMIAIDIGIAAYNIASAPAVDRPRVLMQEVGGVAGALGGGAAGAKAGAWIGGGIGAWFGGAGAAPGAAIGAVVGGIGGAIAGAWGGRKLGDFVADQFYPPAQTGFEGSYQ